MWPPSFSEAIVCDWNTEPDEEKEWWPRVIHPTNHGVLCKGRLEHQGPPLLQALGGQGSAWESQQDFTGLV